MNPSFSKHESHSGIAYYRRGAGTRLVLIHGVGLRAESWSPLINQLGSSYDVIALDIPGQGKSEPLVQGFESARLDDYVNRIVDLLDELALDDFYLCGHSLGSLIALQLALRLPNKVLGVAALNGVYQRDESALKAVQQRASALYQSEQIIGVDETVERWFGSNPEGVQEKHAHWCRNWLSANAINGYATAYKVFAAGRGPSPADLGALTCPTVFMTGGQDPNSTTAMSEQMARVAKTAIARCLADAAHMMPLTHAAQVARELQRLVETSTAQAAKPVKAKEA